MIQTGSGDGATGSCPPARLTEEDLEEVWNFVLGIMQR